MIYNLIYEGNDPPADMSGDLEQEIDDASLATKFAAGRALDNNYNLIVETGGLRKYWYPDAAPKVSKAAPPQVTPPTISQDELATLKTAIAIIQKLATAS